MRGASAMRPVWFLTTVAALMSVLFPPFARVMSGAHASGPPFAPGTTWTYRHTIVREPGTSQTATFSGTLRLVYGGTGQYRGKTYHYLDDSSTVQPGLLERVYLVWTGKTFHQVALVATDTQNHVLELVFDKGVPTGPPEDQEKTSGKARVFQNGRQAGMIPWSFAASRKGLESVTVPAGTFQAIRWTIEFKLDQDRRVVTVFTVGMVDIRIDEQLTADGHTATETKELQSGPVR